MYNRSGIDAYRTTDAQTMTREKLIVLLYEKIVSNLHEAQQAADTGDRLAMTQALNHSQRIISELRNALDHSIGGDISRNLESLYDYMFHEHLQMLVNSDPTHAENCLRVIQPLLKAWRTIPVGTGEQAARDHARGCLVTADGPNPASVPDETVAAGAGDPATAGGNASPTMAELVSVSA